MSPLTPSPAVTLSIPKGPLQVQLDDSAGPPLPVTSLSSHSQASPTPETSHPP